MRAAIALILLLALVAGVFIAGVGASAGSSSGLGSVGVLVTLVAVLGFYIWSIVFVLRNGGRSLGVLVFLFWPLGMLVYLYRQYRGRASIAAGSPLPAFPLKKCSAVLAGTVIALVALGIVDGGWSATTSHASDKESLASSGSGPSSTSSSSALAPDATSTPTPLPTASPTETPVPTSTPVPTATAVPTDTPEPTSTPTFAELLAPYQEIPDVRDADIRPGSLYGTQIKFHGTVATIHVASSGSVFTLGDREQREFTTYLQVTVPAVDGSDVWFVVGFDGDSEGIYEGDRVSVYGEIIDQDTFENSLGGSITQPLVSADYIQH